MASLNSVMHIFCANGNPKYSSESEPRRLEKNGRSSAGYKPSSWSHEYIKSLQINHADEAYMGRVKLLEDTVRKQLVLRVEGDFTDGGDLKKLEEIDSVTKLGLGYRFQTEINQELETLSLQQNSISHKGNHDIYETALRFRLARRNGIQTSQDVFKCFLDKNGKFDLTHSGNVHGMLALYEAASLATDEEHILEEARAFSTLHLSNHLKRNIHGRLAYRIRRALELPSHWRVQRLEAHWHIINYEQDTPLLELATLNYNLVQKTLQTDLKEMSSWWEDTGLSKKLSFARDRLMECFFWATGMVSEPEFASFRKGATQIAILITVIDDVYDVYGSLDELELFTEAVQRWDLECISDLPEYMKHCFLALYNTVNKMASDVFDEKGVNVTKLFAKSWADLCAAFLVEARWSHAKHTPSFDEYLNNGWLSVSGPLLLVYAYCLSQPLSIKNLESFQNMKDFLLWPSMIFRLTNDLATYSAEMGRGESANSVVCYMLETGVSEAKACAHIRDLIEKSWKKMNCYLLMDKGSVVTKNFKEIVINLGRIAHCVYQHGDGHGAPDKLLKEHVMSLIINSI